ncbi:MAG: hypothetical protein Q7T57_04890, partial [Dehalococcoidales bacterium]|nr:hypothetical protein [Dehalococcoidales bacterium]
CTLMALSPHFAQFGNITSFKVLGDSAALVQMSTPAEAAAALHSEKAVLGNRFIQVEYAKGEGAPANFTTTSSHHPKPSYGKPFNQSAASASAPAPLSALEVAKALMATHSTPAAALDATAGDAASTSEGPATAPAAVTPKSTAAADLQAMKARLQQQLLNKQLAAQRDLQQRLTNERDTLTIAEKQALMSKLAIISAEVKQAKQQGAPVATTHTATWTPAAVAAAPPAPKLSALEVVRQMREKQAAAAAAAAAANADPSTVTSSSNTDSNETDDERTT